MWISHVAFMLPFPRRVVKVPLLGELALVEVPLLGGGPLGNPGGLSIELGNLRFRSVGLGPGGLGHGAREPELALLAKNSNILGFGE